MQQEHYSVYRAILRAHGVEEARHKKKFGAIFFQHVKKLINFWSFVKIKAAKFKLNHFG